MEHKDDAPIVLVRSPLAYRCVNCKAVFEVRVRDEGEKATLAVVEFCPVCSMPYDRLWAERDYEAAP